MILSSSRALTDKKKKAMERMSGLVNGRHKGMFLANATKVYTKKYNALFPPDAWAKMIETKLVSISDSLPG